MLKELHLKLVGPAPKFDVEFADRLNIFTGDNGLGKTFLLDIAWWSLTNTWVEYPALPQRIRGEIPEINYLLLNELDTEPQSVINKFNFPEQRWQKDQNIVEKNQSNSKNNLVIYAHVDGGISVCDDARRKPFSIVDSLRLSYNFTPKSLWNGLESNDGKVLCNGMIQDWLNWQNQPDKLNFELLNSVLKKLFVSNEFVAPGKPTRISTDDVRDIPTINLPFGNVPITHTSASMKRILGLAYILVWTWYEHKIASELLNQDPANQLILLIDEVESHLHPRWQRGILPALLEAINELNADLKIQVLATTHSPLVLASLEPIFDEEKDRLFIFELEGEKVSLDEFPWTKQGDTVGWLTSEIFGLKQARSREAEIAIEAAEAWMRHDNINVFPDNLRTPEQIHQQLIQLLPGHDPFWPRWIIKMETR